MTTRRRFACAGLALGVAALLFRVPLAAAVVTRGDDALRNGDRATALRSYRKALILDPGSAVAADRLAFELALRHRRVDAIAAIDLAGSALRHHPDDPALLADRGFAELEVSLWSAARDDFRRLQALTGDPRYARGPHRAALAADPDAANPMTPPEAGAVTLASASAAWWIAAGAARRRGLALGWPPILAFAGITLLSALLPPHDVARAVVLGGIAVAAICDARTGLIFAPLTSALAGAALAAASVDGHAAGAACGALGLGAALLALYALTAGRGIGLGDVRLGVGLGAGLGIGTGFIVLGWAFGLGGAVAAVLLLAKRVRRGSSIRFAPFIAAGAVAALAPPVLFP